MPFVSENLKGSYNWQTGADDPKLKGRQDHWKFNRRQGNEVLFIANHFLEDNQISDIQSLHVLEDLILEQMPGYVLSQRQAYDWFRIHWGEHYKKAA